DKTISIVEDLKDPRIRVISNPTNLGYVRNFENLIAEAKGDYIFLSDQDDIWPAGRVEKMISAMEESDSLLVVGGMESFVDDVESRQFFCGFDATRNASPVKNVVDIFVGRSVPYYGCAMLLSKKIKPYLIPFHSAAISHDIWIAFVANRRRSVAHIIDTVTLRRIHGNNLTNSNRGFVDKIKTRLLWVVAILKLV
ncbi:MAG: glycosyltransferase, partial [Anaerolineales bacterium]